MIPTCRSPPFHSLFSFFSAPSFLSSSLQERERENKKNGKQGIVDVSQKERERERVMGGRSRRVCCIYSCLYLWSATVTAAKGELANDYGVPTCRWMLSGFMTLKFGGNKFSPGETAEPPVCTVIVRATSVVAGRSAGRLAG